MITCKLFNLKTRTTVEAESVKEFCRSVGMNDQRDVIHMYPVLRGERLHHRGWTLPKHMDTRLALRDVYGNKYEGTLAELIYKHKIPSSRLWNLMTGKKKVFQGLFLAGTEHVFLHPKPFKATKFIFVTPNNKEISGKTVRAVERQIHSRRSYGLFTDVVHGRSSSKNGYALKEIVLKKRSVLTEHVKKRLVRLNTTNLRT